MEIENILTNLPTMNWRKEITNILDIPARTEIGTTCYIVPLEGVYTFIDDKWLRVMEHSTESYDSPIPINETTEILYNIGAD